VEDVEDVERLGVEGAERVKQDTLPGPKYRLARLLSSLKIGGMVLVGRGCPIVWDAS
jgi:hypothetical protein